MVQYEEGKIFSTQIGKPINISIHTKSLGLFDVFCPFFFSFFLFFGKKKEKQKQATRDRETSGGSKVSTFLNKK